MIVRKTCFSHLKALRPGSEFLTQKRSQTLRVPKCRLSPRDEQHIHCICAEALDKGLWHVKLGKGGVTGQGGHIVGMAISWMNEFPGLAARGSTNCGKLQDYGRRHKFY